ncbi:MAG: hypothetical protein AAGU75_08695, partial [Bacillota bacterium]
MKDNEKRKQITQKRKEVSHMNKLISFIVALALVFSLVIPFSGAAFATEVEPPIEGLDEGGGIAAPITCIDELLLAISSASDGDTLYLSQSIFVSDNTVLGDSDKHITIARDSDFSNVMFYVNTTTEKAIFRNMSIDGNAATINGAAVEVCGDTDFNDVIFENHISQRSSALNILGGSNVYINHCIFEGNMGRE